MINVPRFSWNSEQTEVEMKTFSLLLFLFKQWLKFIEQKQNKKLFNWKNLVAVFLFFFFLFWSQVMLWRGAHETPCKTYLQSLLPIITARVYIKKCQIYESGVCSRSRMKNDFSFNSFGFYWHVFNSKESQKSLVGDMFGSRDTAAHSTFTASSGTVSPEMNKGFCQSDQQQRRNAAVD